MCPRITSGGAQCRVVHARLVRLVLVPRRRGDIAQSRPAGAQLRVGQSPSSMKLWGMFARDLGGQSLLLDVDEVATIGRQPVRRISVNNFTR